MLQKTVFITFLISIFGLASVWAQTDTAKQISVGVANGRADSLPKPAYPAAARAVKASGTVNVQVLIDEEGNVVSAQTVSGHPLLRQAAEQAALGAKFKPTFLQGQPVKVSGIIVYNFVAASGVNWINNGFSLGIAEIKGVGSRIDLPDEFSDEEKQLEMLNNFSPQEQTPQIANIISIIKSKLTPAELWRFEFGLAKGRILTKKDGDNALFINLAKFKELAASKPEGVQTYEINRAAELAKFADKAGLTGEDKKAIFSLLQ